MSIKWGANLTLNIEEIDEQHQKLINIMNALYDSLQSDNRGEMEKKTLVELIEYSDYHFSTEKELMEKYKYPDMDDHLGKHEEFVAKLKELCHKHQKDNVEVSREIIAFLTEWIVSHIMEIDIEFGKFLKGKGVS